MSFASGVAVYFIVWWLCLFAVLPFGIRSAHEAGEAVQQGHESGAPVNPMILRKVMWNTIVATIVFLLVYGQVTYGWISFDDIPFLSSMPRG